MKSDILLTFFCNHEVGADLRISSAKMIHASLSIWYNLCHDLILFFVFFLSSMAAQQDVNNANGLKS